MNLNAQPGASDEDISITHRKTGMRLKVESKSAVRGSMSDGKRTRSSKLPHFNVKCHRSRSHIKKAATSNDRYEVDAFDLLITNTSNAIYQGKTIGEHLEVIHNDNIRTMLYEFYKTKNETDLKIACEQDWRFVIPQDIAENGFLPRVPLVQLSADPHWFRIDLLNHKLEDVVQRKRNKS